MTRMKISYSFDILLQHFYIHAEWERFLNGCGLGWSNGSVVSRYCALPSLRQMRLMCGADAIQFGAESVNYLSSTAGGRGSSNSAPGIILQPAACERRPQRGLKQQRVCPNGCKSPQPSSPSEKRPPLIASKINKTRILKRPFLFHK